MRQAGYLAAAGIYALTHNIERLKDDHENALTLARQLGELSQIHIEISQVQTNIIFARIDTDMPALHAHLKRQGIIIDTANPLRLVTHLDISFQDIRTIVQAFKSYFE